MPTCSHQEKKIDAMTGKLKAEVTYGNCRSTMLHCEAQMLNIWETLIAVGVENQISWGQHGISSLTLL